jgi:Zn-dependent peptidase ImmA (M78 family)
MIKTFDYSTAQQRAIKILERYKISTLPVNPVDIAKTEGLMVKEIDKSELGVSGMLLRSGEQYGIMYSTYLHNQGFENFSIAHELGHFYLDGHIDHVFKTGNIHLSNAGSFSKDRYEQEADAFAASLLMPESMLKDILWKMKDDFSGIESLSKLCNTSLTASALRFVDLTENFMIVIISTNNIVDYCKISKKVWNLKDIFIPKHGQKIPPNTVTEKIYNNSDNTGSMNRLSGDVDISDWLETEKSYYATEEVIRLGKYGRVLTVISK